MLTATRSYTSLLYRRLRLSEYRSSEPTCPHSRPNYRYLVYLSRSDLEVVDASTLWPTAYLKLPTRSRTTEAVYHSENRTILAILKEAETLTLYSIQDIQQH